jgi:hypothetical protein
MDLFGISPPDDEQEQPANVRKLPRIKGELTRLQGKFLEDAVALYGETALERGSLGYLHSLLANCYLPRAKTTERRYVHQNGAYSILISAGELVDPVSGDWVEQPLPFGGKPRALMAYLNTYAIRNNTREVPLGHSLSDFVRMMSGEVSGGERGTLTLWKTQMMALAACSMRIGGSYGEGTGMPNQRAKTRKVDIISELDLWLSPEPNQYSLFPTDIKLSTEYFESLREHAMPVDLKALKLLQGDPLAFDVYAWLVYRLPRIRQQSGVKLPWKLIYDQFGGNYKEIKTFKRRFLEALKKVKVLYPNAQLDIGAEALTLKSTPSLVPHTVSVRKLADLREKVK